MIKPYYEDEWVKLFHGNCLEIIPELKNIDAVITDPPYNIGTPQLVTFNNHGKEAQKRVIGKDFGVFDEGAITPAVWMPIARNSLKNEGVIVSFYGSKNMDKLMTADPELEIIQDFHWIKPAPAVPLRSVGFSWGVESGYIFRKKGFKHKHNNEAGISPNYLITHRCSNGEMVGHPTQKPFELARWLISHWSFPSETILDPFVGSGTFIVEAKALGRKAIGIEINEEYCQMAVKRLSQSVMDLGV